MRLLEYKMPIIALKTSQDKQSKLKFSYQFYVLKFLDYCLLAESYFYTEII